MVRKAICRPAKRSRKDAAGLRKTFLLLCSCLIFLGACSSPIVCRFPIVCHFLVDFSTVKVSEIEAVTAVSVKRTEDAGAHVQKRTGTRPRHLTKPMAFRIFHRPLNIYGVYRRRRSVTRWQVYIWVWTQRV